MSRNGEWQLKGDGINAEEQRQNTWTNIKVRLTPDSETKQRAAYSQGIATLCAMWVTVYRLLTPT